MKKIILSFSLLALVGCENNTKKINKPIYLSNECRIIEIDGCEYIQSHVKQGYSICHKGNCKNHLTQSQTLEKYGKVITENQ
jgi:hypothetical protein